MYSKCNAYPVLERFSDMPISRQKSWNKNKFKNNLSKLRSDEPYSFYMKSDIPVNIVLFIKWRFSRKLWYTSICPKLIVVYSILTYNDFLNLWTYKFSNCFSLNVNRVSWDLVVYERCSSTRTWIQAKDLVIFFSFVGDTEKREGCGSGFSRESNSAHYLLIPSPASTIS